MEPMALGSPVGSPTGAPSSPTTSPFLPSYLMGDNAPNASTPRSGMQIRQQTPKHVHFASSGLAMPNVHANAPTTIGSSRTLQSVTSPEKPASDFGPPVLGLFDTLSPLPAAGISSHLNSTFPSTSGLYSSSVYSPNASLFTSPVGTIQPTSHGNPQHTLNPSSIFESESQKLHETTSNKESRGGDGVFGSPMESEQNTWVTVFGFMPDAVNDIIAHFVHCGTILEHKWGSQAGEGKNSVQRCNWIHLCFRTIREARRAIAKNGKVFGGCMMVGVVPCQDPEILHSQKENIQGPEINFPAKPKNSSCAISGIRPLGVDFISPVKEPSKLRASRNSSNESPGIRPLMRSNSLPQNEMDSGGLMKNNGLISRTIDFLFGQ